MNRKILIKIIEKNWLLGIITVASLWIVTPNFLTKRLILDSFTQNLNPIKDKTKNILSQFKEIIELVEGSKEENRLVIMFIVLHYSSFLLP